MSAGEILTLMAGAAWYGGGMWLLVRVQRADAAARREYGGDA